MRIHFLFILIVFISYNQINAMYNPQLLRRTPSPDLPELSHSFDFEPSVNSLQKIRILAQSLQAAINIDSLFYLNYFAQPKDDNYALTELKYLSKMLKEYLKKDELKQSTRHLIAAILKLTSSEATDASILEEVIHAIPSFKIKNSPSNSMQSDHVEFKTDECKQQMLSLLAERQGRNRSLQSLANHQELASDSYGEYFKCSTPTP